MRCVISAPDDESCDDGRSHQRDRGDAQEHDDKQGKDQEKKNQDRNQQAKNGDKQSEGGQPSPEDAQKQQLQKEIEKTADQGYLTRWQLEHHPELTPAVGRVVRLPEPGQERPAPGRVPGEPVAVG